MPLRFDHLVVAARALDEGVAWIESRLGVAMGPGGRHDLMGTHNRLLSLGPGRFLEVIAIDPDAPPPGRARWFGLDTPEMRARLEGGPALVTWVARADALGSALAASGSERCDVLSVARGDFRWRIGVPPDGSLAQSGISPTMIQWQTHHPADVLPDVGCRLEKLVLRHPQAIATLAMLRAAGLPADEAVEAQDGAPGLAACVRTPRGVEEIR